MVEIDNSLFFIALGSIVTGLCVAFIFMRKSSSTTNKSTAAALVASEAVKKPRKKSKSKPSKSGNTSEGNDSAIEESHASKREREIAALLEAIEPEKKGKKVKEVVKVKDVSPSTAERGIYVYVLGVECVKLCNCIYWMKSCRCMYTCIMYNMSVYINICRCVYVFTLHVCMCLCL